MSSIHQGVLQHPLHPNLPWATNLSLTQQSPKQMNKEKLLFFSKHIYLNMDLKYEYIILIDILNHFGWFCFFFLGWFLLS